MIVADGGYINEFNIPVTVECIVRESQRQHIEPELLWAILRVENGRVGAHSKNKNSSFDIGPMQINTGINDSAIDKLYLVSSYAKKDFKKALYNDACFNISVGAYILKSKIVSAGGNKFRGAGWYHSSNEPHYSKYLTKVKNHYYALKNSAINQQQIVKAKKNQNAQAYAIQPKKVYISKKSFILHDYPNHPSWLRPSNQQYDIPLKIKL